MAHPPFVEQPLRRARAPLLQKALLVGRRWVRIVRGPGRWRRSRHFEPGTIHRDELCVPNLAVQLNRLSLPNPILVASGTFGYAREMQAFIDFRRLGGIIPKTVT